MVEYAFTVKGNNRATAVTARTPALLGFSSDRSPVSGDWDWEFVDWPFRDTATASRFRHKLQVEAQTPLLAVAPDIAPDPTTGQQTLSGDVLDPADERNALSPDTVLDVAGDMAEHAEHVIIVPTDDSFPVDSVPDEFRVGVPASAAFGIETIPDDLLFSIDAYNRHPGGVHILGGGPNRQLSLRPTTAGPGLEDIRSIDTSMAAGRAVRQAGKVWDGEKFRSRENQPDWLRDLDLWGKMYVTHHTYAHSWGIVDLLDQPRVTQQSGETKADTLLRAAMTDAERDIVKIAQDLIPESLEPDVRLDQQEGRLVATASAADVIGDQFTDFTETLRDFGFTDIESNMVRGGVIITARLPDPDPDTSAFGTRPDA